MKTVSFGNMTDYDAEAQQLAERKRYAEALRAQGQQAPQGRMAGRVYVPPNPLEHLANALRQYSGQRELQDVRTAEQGLTQRKQTDLANYLKSMPQATTEQQLVGDRPGAGSFEPVTKQPAPDDYFNWMAQGSRLGPQAMQLGQMAYQGAVRNQDRADDRTFRTETLKSEQAFREQQAAEARQQRMVEIQLRLQDAQLSREQNAALRREMAQLAASNKQSAQPYYQPVQTTQGVMAFNARTGKMEPVQIDGQSVVGAQADPALQGSIAGAKAAGTERAKNLVDAQAEAPKVQEQAAYTVKLIDDILAHPGKKMAVGTSSINPLNFVPGTDGRDFRNRLEQLQGQQFLQAFESLKGGGQITNVEGEKATRAISRMQTAQSETEFDTAAKEFREIVQRGADRAKAKAAPPASKPRRYNPETGGLE